MAMIYDLAVGALRWWFDRRITTPPALPTADNFPHAQRFTAEWQEIAREAQEVARTILQVPRFHELMPEQASISAADDRDWRMFVLKAYGVGIAGNLARCPRLAGLLAACPEVLSATFSFLAPGKDVPSHRGPFRGILRFHLMLAVPRLADGRPAAVLRIAGVDHPLGEGAELLWDDTYPHAVWNHGTEIRTALLLDVRRPRMPWDLAVLSRAVVAAVGLSLRCNRAVRALMEGRTRAGREAPAPARHPVAEAERPG